jgi:hypothetical protein
MSLILRGADEAWHAKIPFASRALELAHTHGLWFDFKFLETSTRNAKPTNDRQLTTGAKRWKDGSWTIGSSAEILEQPYLQVGLRANAAEIKIRTPGASTELLDGWTALCRNLHEDLADVQVSWKGIVYSPDLRYPLRRPPLWHELHRFGLLMDVLDLRAVRKWIPETEEAVRSAALPPGATRIVDGDLYVLRWIDDPSDPVSQAIGCVRQEEWWAKHLEPATPMGWNAAGDRQVATGRLAAKKPFTLYDEQKSIGYLAVVVGRGGALSGPSWAEIEKLAGKHKLRLLVPVRDNALTIGERARAAGVDAVLYQEDDELWDPMPRGEWREAGMSLAEIERRLTAEAPSAAK